MTKYYRNSKSSRKCVTFLSLKQELLHYARSPLADLTQFHLQVCSESIALKLYLLGHAFADIIEPIYSVFMC
jgi:hypothetical protein